MQNDESSATDHSAQGPTGDADRLPSVDLSAGANGKYFQQDYKTKTPPIEGVQIENLRRFNDDGGSMTELGRLTGGRHRDLPGFEVRQVNYSEMEPGAIKAFHLHRKQTDVWFVPPTSKMLLVLGDERAHSETAGERRRHVLGDGTSKLVRIPPGVAHGVRNLASTRGQIIYFVNLHFSPEPGDCDEGRLPWDHYGTDIWEMEKI